MWSNCFRSFGCFRSKTPEKLLAVGDTAPDFELTDIDGVKRKLSSLRGQRVLLSFFQFAACPVCQYSYDRMKKQSEMLERGEIATLCIFQSTPEIIAKFTKVKAGTSLLLSDQKCTVYTTFAGEITKTVAEVYGDELTVNEKRYKPYWTKEFTEAFNKEVGMLKPSQLPACFLINEDGEIVDLFRADSVTDHMSFERIEAFIPEAKRCKCYKKDCISARCRKEYDEIKKSDQAMLHF